jgi:hypothetical protein
VFSRALARDYLDLAGILQSGRYTKDRLLELGASVDAGFSRARFAEALAAIDRFVDQDFTRYGVNARRLKQVRQAIREWSHELSVEVTREEVERTPSPETSRPGPEPGVPPLASQRRRAQLLRRYGSWTPQAVRGLDQPSRGRGIDL